MSSLYRYLLAEWAVTVAAPFDRPARESPLGRSVYAQVQHNIQCGTSDHIVWFGGWSWFWLFHPVLCSVWAVVKLAKMALQVVENMEHNRAESTQPNNLTRWTTLYIDLTSNRNLVQTKASKCLFSKWSNLNRYNDDLYQMLLMHFWPLLSHISCVVASFRTVLRALCCCPIWIVHLYAPWKHYQRPRAPCAMHDSWHSPMIASQDVTIDSTVKQRAD